MTITVFTATDANIGTELWATDGTSGRTTLLKDIYTGSTGGVPNSGGPSNTFGGAPATQSGFAVLGGFAYFSATDAAHGTELWRTDGTAAGTVIVTDAIAGAASSGPNNIVTANGALFYTGLGGASVYGIYKSTGVPGSSPTLVMTPSGFLQMVGTSGRMYWAQDDSGGSSGLWTSDGVAAPQHLVTVGNNGGNLIDMGSGIIYYATSFGLRRVSGTTVTTITGTVSNTTNYTAVNGTLFFTTFNGTILHKVAPGDTATTQVKTGLSFTFPVGGPSFAAAGSNLIFTSTDAQHGVEVWVSDGTSGGTFMLKDILPGTGPTDFNIANNSQPKNLTTVGNLVYFQDGDGQGGVDLWKTDGTTAGTVLVKHIMSGNFGASGAQAAPDLQNMSSQGGLLMFAASDGVHGTELWRSDGTALGTMQIKNINTSSQLNVAVDTSVSTSMTYLSSTGAAYFLGSDSAHGNELWVGDGTVAGSHMLLEINPGFGNSNPTGFVLNTSVTFLFTANDGTHGSELWASNGTAAGTHMVLDINPGSGGSLVSGITTMNIGGRALFNANDGVHGSELWITDGTAAGTQMVLDINPGSSGGNPNSSGPFGFIQVGSNFFFQATTTGQGNELWVTDGTPGATHITKDIFSGTTDSGINLTQSPGNNYFGVIGSKIYFTANDSVHGTEMWFSDGSPGGTQILKDINTTGANGSNPHSYVTLNSKIYFIADNGGVNGNQLYVTDGSAANTIALTNQQWNSSLQTLVASGNNLFFTGQGASGNELYVTSGGAPTLIDISPGVNGSNPFSLTAVGGGLVMFTADNQTNHGQELWISDGTALGTTMVKDVNPGVNGSNISNITHIGNGLTFFTATDGTHGIELWVTDGTGPNTHMVLDINPGSGDGNVSFLRDDQSFVTFYAADATNGTEVWQSDGTPGGTFRITDNTQELGSSPSNFTTLSGTLDPGAETLNGTALGDYLDGGSGADTINGLAGDDTLIGGAANDLIDGGAGYDTAKYTGNAFSPVPQETYTFDQGTTQIVLTDTRGAVFDGTDTLTNVEQLNFNDGYVVFDTAANLKTWQSHPVHLDSGGSIQDSFYKGDYDSVWENFVDTTNASNTLWRTTHFDAAGNAIAQLETFDNGTHELTILDPNEIYSFATVVISYDSAWNQTNVTELNDDASATVRPGEIGTAFDTVVWYITPYDPNGGAAVNDTLTGGSNSNVLFGFAGDDVLVGGTANDVLNGGRGTDVLTGGAGDDKFLFSFGDGNDIITDFVAGAGSGDVISLHGYGVANFAQVQALMAQSGTATVITFDVDNQIVLQGVTMANLTAGDFLFS